MVNTSMQLFGFRITVLVSSVILIGNLYNITHITLSNICILISVQQVQLKSKLRHTLYIQRTIMIRNKNIRDTYDMTMNLTYNT